MDSKRFIADLMGLFGNGVSLLMRHGNYTSYELNEGFWMRKPWNQKGDCPASHGEFLEGSRPEKSEKHRHTR